MDRLPSIPVHRWLWPARPVRAIDGDTLELLVDRGFRGTSRERVRLLGVDTPEVVGRNRAAGLAATAYTADWLGGDPAADWPLVIETFRPRERDSFGRWLATIWRVSDGHCLNADLIHAGHAVAVD